MDHLADDFWNMRGDFRISPLINIGTHMSLIRRPSGRFVLLDSYELDDADQARLLALTEGGSQIEAVLNLHPFHTIHCAFVQNSLPNARLIGTRRHHHRLPHLDWDPALIEMPTTQRQFADILDFSIPPGVDFISADENVHVASVIARHRASGIVHVDDTLNVLDLPSLVQKLVPGPRLRFHPKLADGLQKRAGAADDYIGWATGLAQLWADTKIGCAAHSAVLALTEESFGGAIGKALDYAANTLDQHRETYG